MRLLYFIIDLLGGLMERAMYIDWSDLGDDDA